MKVLVTAGKRKRAIAKAVIKAGTGEVTVNNIGIDVIEPKIARMKLQEPLLIAGDGVSKVDIRVNVKGGGFSSQADAARLAIAKALVGFLKDKKLEKAFLDYDRHLLVADIRRKEVRKPNRHGKARAKTQKSYR
ncbi:30S ribosomal protein S9 [Candidatus Woesearchaeota archaeon]|nr:30S ribosomal protein S9 [Candidatus Woesearchaeota archaeon]